MKFEDLLHTIKALNLPAQNYAVFGSGPLIIRGLIPFSNDLDIICRGEAWEMVQKIGQVQYLEKYDVTIVSLMDGIITFGTQWGIGNPNIDDLIDSSELIAQIPFVSLKHVIRYKRLRNSLKDQSHIEAIRQSAFADALHD